MSRTSSLVVWLVLLLTTLSGVEPYCPIGKKNHPPNEDFSCRIFLDHGGHNFHAEVFYPTAVLMVTRHWPSVKLSFVIQKRFGRLTGLNEFWRKHASEGVLGDSFQYEFVDIPEYKPLANCLVDGSPSTIARCTRSDIYDARVLVTVSLGWKEDRLCPLKNHPNFAFIIHHAEVSPNTTASCNGVSREIIQWKNSYVAGEMASLRGKFLSLNDFTPSAQAISPYPLYRQSAYLKPSLSMMTSSTRPSPICIGKLPVAIVQGEISNRRDLSEIKAVLEAGGKNIYAKVLTRSPPLDSFVKRSTWKGKWIKNANMTRFHRAFQGAAFLVAGMSPDLKQDYFRGHPSSNIAYAMHFGLQIIGHEAIPQEYLALQKKFEGGEPAGFWHDGSPASIADATARAIAAWRQRCLNEQQS
mmetsp:Transcript_10291/g.19170  ORF Transcript_10291/g.19170 Transcript_10291/m.19170 type:complete len:412 (-) Transcript_10291:250-1485(-)